MPSRAFVFDSFDHQAFSPACLSRDCAACERPETCPCRCHPCVAFYRAVLDHWSDLYDAAPLSASRVRYLFATYDGLKAVLTRAHPRLFPVAGRWRQQERRQP